MDNKSIIKEFTKQNGISPEDIDIKQECQSFMREMEAGLKGESSLRMLPSYITIGKQLPLNEKVIVMDAGGTNFRVGVVHFNERAQAVIEDFSHYEMPGSQGEITKDEFYDIIAERLRPLVKCSSKIGFCFSYATEALPNKDGRLLQFSKEIKVSGLKGQEIGRGVLEKLKEKGLDGDKSIVIINDTVATLLAGQALSMEKSYGGYIGYILGTGTNTCYVEKNENITKQPGLMQGSMLVNMESGGYNGFRRGNIDKYMDSHTSNPGEYQFEKMISGQYLGSVIYSAILKAIEAGLFTQKAALNLKNLQHVAAIEADEFMRKPYGPGRLGACFDKEDRNSRERLYFIIDSILERGAKLVTVNLISVMLKGNIGTSPLEPVCITTEGSTFYKLYSYKSKIEYYLKKHLTDEENRYYEITRVDNSSLIGAAIAGLMA